MAEMQILQGAFICPAVNSLEKQNGNNFEMHKLFFVHSHIEQLM